MRGPDTVQTVNALFKPFWDEEIGFREVADVRVCGNQWEVPAAWARRARDDGSGNALALLDFRINFLCRLLAVSDCWPTAIGNHLAHWLDAHVHLTRACARLESGPPRDSAVDSWVLRTCDWRYHAAAHTLAVREIFISNESQTSALGGLYNRLLANMAQCKTLHRTMASVGVSAVGRETICSAVVRCLLGVNSIKANLRVRSSVHAALCEGCSAFFDKVVSLGERSDDPIVFAALREFTVLSALDDMSLATFLSKTPKWNAFAANAINTAEMIRVRLRNRGSVDDLFTCDQLESKQNEEKLALMRQCRKVPGLFARPASRDVSLRECCRLLKRFRDKRAGTCALNTDAFANAHNMAVVGMLHMSGLPLASRVPLAIVQNALDASGPAAKRAFVDVVAAMSKGVESLLFEANAHAGSNPLALSEAFVMTVDCLELINHCNSFFEVELPMAYGNRQRAAVRRRFAHSGIPEEEMWARAAEIVWCGGCKTIKNFVLSNSKKDARNHQAHGYKRVSLGPAGVMCYEKKKFLCCRAVPVRRCALLSARASSCVSLFGCAYAISTCCGQLAQLNHLTTRGDEPLCCQRCALAQTVTATAHTLRICYYCNLKIADKKHGFTGQFQRDSGASEILSFCKRHVRECMRRENEPIILAECVRQLGKKFKR